MNQTYCKRLEEIASGPRWQEAVDKLSAYINWRVKGKTQYGAHSEVVLGVPALEYYSCEAIAKLCSGEWEWPEDVPVADQLIKIAGSLISRNVAKWQRKSNDTPIMVDAQDVADILEDETISQDEFYDQLKAKAAGDQNLLSYIEAVRVCEGDYVTVCEYLGISRAYAYNLQRRLMDKLDKSKNQ